MVTEGEEDIQVCATATGTLSNATIILQLEAQEVTATGMY